MKKNGYALELRLVKWSKDHRIGVTLGTGKRSALVTSEEILAEDWLGSFAKNKEEAFFRFAQIQRAVESL